MTLFRGFTSKKPPRSSLKWYFLPLRELLKYQNCRSTCQKLMKLDRDMYQLDAFHLHKSGGGSEWAGWGRIQKTIKKCQEIKKSQL